MESFFFFARVIYIAESEGSVAPVDVVDRPAQAEVKGSCLLLGLIMKC